MRAIRAFHSANRGRVRSTGTGRHIGEAPALWERPPVRADAPELIVAYPGSRANLRSHGEEERGAPCAPEVLDSVNATNCRQAAAAKMAVEGASKFYATDSGSLHALDDVSIDVREGEFLCVLGPSGCGKTTLLWCMAGLHALSSGAVRIGVERVEEPHPEIAMIFQDANLLPWRDLMGNIRLPFEIKRKRPDAERIRQLLEQVGLSGFEAKFPRELSGGMQQRASIVRSLAVDPSVLLMDEPFGALDAFTRDEMNLLIQRIWMRTGKTIVFVTHSIPEAIFLADRVAVMSARPGRIAKVFDVDIPRPRSVDIVTTPEFIGRVLEVKATIES